MKSWTIGRRLLTGVGALVVLLLGVASLALFVGRTLEDRLVATSDHTVKRLQLALQLEAELERAYAAQPSVTVAALVADKAQVEARRVQAAEAIASVDGTILQMKSELAGDGERETVATITADVEAWKRAYGEADRLIDAGTPAKAVEVESKNADAFKTKTRDALSELVGRHQESLQFDIEGARSSITWVRVLVFVGVIVALVLAGLVVWSVVDVNTSLLSQSSQLRDGAEHVVAAAAQVATSAQGLSQAATEQAASLEETSASMEEMASMTRKNAENAAQAATLATDVADQVNQSNNALVDMVTAMTAIKESSNKVAKIIKTIDEIAFQTNILALNAAVEAARAGEAGMGFAVVADEVRSLAQRSAQAAKDTAGLLEESITRSQEGTGKVEQVALSISAITNSVSQVKSMIDEVRHASRQQTQGIDQVTQAIAQMERVTQTTAATAEESAAASEELNAQAEQAMSIVSKLELLVGGRIRLLRRSRVASVRSTGFRTRETPAHQPYPSMSSEPIALPEDPFPMGETGSHGKF